MSTEQFRCVWHETYTENEDQPMDVGVPYLQLNNPRASSGNPKLYKPTIWAWSLLMISIGIVYDWVYHVKMLK